MKTAQMKYRIKGTQLYVSDGGGQAYDAAGHGRRLRSWAAPSIGPNSALSFNLPDLRNRSRDQVRKNTYAARASDVFVSNTVGTGIRPLSKAHHPASGEGGDDDRRAVQTFRTDVQDLWRDWVDESDADGLLSFYGQQSQVARALYEGGECFIRRRLRRPSDGFSVPMQIQVLEGEHVPVEKNELARNGNVIRHGIEFDAVGRRVAYHMYRKHPGDHSGFEVMQTREFAAGQTVRVPASEVLHIFLPRRPGQQRGEPWLTRALIKLRDLDGYDDAELVRKKMAAMFLAFTKRVDDSGALQLGDTDAHSEANEGPDVAVQTLEPGTVIPLDDGEDVTFAKGEDVGGQYEAFVRQQLRAIAQSSGVLYEQLTGDYSQINDRTYRAAFNDLRRQTETLQQHVIVYQLCRPVWRWFWDLALAAGELRIPRALTERQARRVDWIPQGWRYIHPVQDVQAERDSIRSGLKSRDKVVSEKGEDIHEVDREISEENERADRMGLVFDSDPRQVSRAGLTQARPAGSVLPSSESEGDDNEDTD